MVEIPNNKEEIVQTPDSSEKSDKSTEVSGKDLEKKVGDIKTPEEFYKTKDVKEANFDSVENVDAKNKKALFELSKDYFDSADIQHSKDLLPQIKDLLVKIYPKEAKLKNLKTSREIETAMKQKISDVVNFLEVKNTVIEKGLTIQQVQEKSTDRNYLFDGKLKYKQDGERISNIKGSQVVGEWNFAAKDVDYTDANTISLVKENVVQLQKQLEEISKNPNIDKNSIRINVNSSASNLAYKGSGGNEGLAKQRAENVQKMIMDSLPDLANDKFVINPQITGPSYPPTKEDLQTYGLGNIDSSDYQNHLSELEEKMYRPFQKVQVSLNYNEIQKEPLYNIQSKNKLYAEAKERPVAQVFDLYMEKGLLDQIDPKIRKEIVDSIQDPQIKEDFTTWLIEQPKFLSANGGIKFGVNTSFDKGIGLLDAAGQTPDNMKYNKLDEVKNLQLYEYQGRDVNDSSNVMASKVPIKKINDVDTLKKFVKLLGNSDTTDKEVKSFFEDNF